MGRSLSLLFSVSASRALRHVAEELNGYSTLGRMSLLEPGGGQGSNTVRPSLDLGKRLKVSRNLVARLNKQRLELRS